jgi:hypothetical protein
LVLATNNPYGAVIRRYVADYFSSGAVSPYLGLWEADIKVYYYHRTLEDAVRQRAPEGPVSPPLSSAG